METKLYSDDYLLSMELGMRVIMCSLVYEDKLHKQTS